MERAFGVLKKKFLALSSGMRFYDTGDIFYLITAAALMHNMMVDERIRCDQIKSEKNFAEIELERENNLNLLTLLEQQLQEMHICLSMNWLQETGMSCTSLVMLSTAGCLKETYLQDLVWGRWSD